MNTSRADRSRAAFGRYGDPPESFSSWVLASSTLQEINGCCVVFQNDVANTVADSGYTHTKVHLSAFVQDSTPEGFTRVFSEQPESFDLGIVSSTRALRTKKSVEAVEEEGEGAHIC